MALPPRGSWFRLTAVILLPLSAVASVPDEIPARADAPLPTELRYTPPDAAVFLHVDVAGLLKSAVAKAARAADKRSLEYLDGTARAVGLRLDELKSVVWFVPKLKRPGDERAFGVVLTSAGKLDSDALTAGLTGALGKGAEFRVLTPSPEAAVVLVGLGDEYAKPKPARPDGPLTPALRAAASGKHALVAALTPANLPDDLRRDQRTPEGLALRPLFRARSITAAVTLGEALDAELRVRAADAADAADVRKALATGAELLTAGFKSGIKTEFPDLDRKAKADAAFEDLAAVLDAVFAAAKAAKVEADGAEVRVTAALPLGTLPLESAFAAAAEQLKEDALARRSAKNLRQIGIALHNYHDAFDQFPPAAVCDKKGKPQLSWRVLILPYLDQSKLYEEFRLDEPWDGEHNKKLLAKMPAVYALPGETKAGGTDTYYRAFVGNGAGWDWIAGGKIGAFTDGLSNTVMAVTAADAVPWTKPDELEFDPEKDMAKRLGRFNGRFQFLFFDGSVRARSKPLDKGTLNAVITRAGDEIYSFDE